ncbi:serine/threonine protein kinase [Ktedonospora formicarum]|nr:serine/threonine-protein kinase [Ktedonospora formicarum]
MVGLAGQYIDQYHLMHLIEERATSDVYLAQLQQQTTPVAIYLFHSRIENEETREQFRTEIEPLLRLKHPHLLSMYSFGEKEHIPYLIAATFSGESLLHHYPLGSNVPLHTVVDVIGQAASALQYMHECGLVYRDIRPDQIWIDANNTVVLRPPELTSLTMTTQYQEQDDLIDLIAYLAPEQRQGRAEPASDQYSLAVVAYELLSGHLPFQGSFLEIIKQQERIPPSLYPETPSLPPAIDAVFARALSHDPASRFPSLLSFVVALQDVADDRESQEIVSGLSQQEQARVKATPEYDPTAQPHQSNVDASGSEKPMVLPIIQGSFQRRDLRRAGLYCAIVVLLQAFAHLMLYVGLQDFVTGIATSSDIMTLSNLLNEFAGTMIAFQLITAILSFPTSYLTGPVFGAWRGAIINLIYYTSSMLGLLVVVLLLGSYRGASEPTNVAPGTIQFYLKLGSPLQIILPYLVSLLGSIAFAFVVGSIYERRKKRNLLISWGIYSLAAFAMILWSNVAFALISPLLGDYQKLTIKAISQTPWISLLIVPPLMVGLEAIVQSYILRRRQRQAQDG